MMETNPTERECGSRADGGFYLETPTSKDGKPIEYFMNCKPVLVDLKTLGLSEIGVKILDVPTSCPECAGVGHLTEPDTFADRLLRQMTGQLSGSGDCPACAGAGRRMMAHVFDVIGADNYPNAWDFLRETEVLGISRKFASTMLDQAARLERHSRFLPVHKTAWIDNANEILGFLTESQRAFFECPKHHVYHQPAQFVAGLFPLDGERAPDPDGEPTCAGMLRHVVTQGKPLEMDYFKHLYLDDSFEGKRMRRLFPFDALQALIQNPLLTVRNLKCGAAFVGFEAPIKPVFKHAVFASFPIGGIALIDPQRRHIQKQSDLAAKIKKLPTRIADA